MITTSGGPLMFNAEYSMRVSTDHGGMRVVMDPGTSGQKIFGTDATYGFDWQSDNAGIWEKRSMTRVLQGVPAGSHRFRMQFRAQATGETIQVHSGNCDPAVQYSGSHMFMQELK